MAWVSTLLDSTVLIDVLRGHAAAGAYLESLDRRPTCSEISRVEVLRGLRSHERSSCERLLGSLAWAPLNEEIARRAGELGRQYRRSHAGFGAADLSVAATAQVLGLPLATANVRHFPMFESLAPPY